MWNLYTYVWPITATKRSMLFWLISLSTSGWMLLLLYSYYFYLIPLPNTWNFWCEHDSSTSIIFICVNAFTRLHSTLFLFVAFRQSDMWQWPTKSLIYSTIIYLVSDYVDCCYVDRMYRYRVLYGGVWNNSLEQ